MLKRLCASALFILLAIPLRPVEAQSASGAQTASAPNAIDEHRAQAVAQPPAVNAAEPPLVGCETELPNARVGAPSKLVVQLDPDTLWRPRGAEVRFTLGSGSGSPPLVSRVLACFRWRLVNVVPRTGDGGYVPSPLIRSVPNTAGLVEYGAIVPSLAEAWHFGSGPKDPRVVEYTGMWTVPIADMQAVVELTDGTRIPVILPVGITYVPGALGVLVMLLACALAVLWRWAPMDARDAARGGLARRLSNHALAVLRGNDNLASLAQFQIMLWAFVVGAAASYVMALSGNLISISAGTLTLLGIAGGTSVLARLPYADTTTAKSDKPPRWRQLLTNSADDTANIDVTRVQMLIFTLVTAVFVAIKVAVSYTIPEIPDNFLLLMGISNGVYIAGRQIPDRSGSPVKR